MNEEDREGFLGRWSRRKLAPAATRSDESQSAETQAADAAAQEEAFADFDFASLDFASDYRRFMANAVPDDVRNRALRQLWSSSDLIAEPDELDEFREDFRDAAKVVPAALARSAYRIGSGFIDDDDTKIAPLHGKPDTIIHYDARDMSGEQATSNSGEDATSDRRPGTDRNTNGDAVKNAPAVSSDRRQSTDG
jgi:hypothetical protein